MPAAALSIHGGGGGGDGPLLTSFGPPSRHVGGQRFLFLEASPLRHMALSTTQIVFPTATTRTLQPPAPSAAAAEGLQELGEAIGELLPIPQPEQAFAPLNGRRFPADIWGPVGVGDASSMGSSLSEQSLRRLVVGLQLSPTVSAAAFPWPCWPWNPLETLNLPEPRRGPFPRAQLSDNEGIEWSGSPS